MRFATDCKTDTQLVEYLGLRSNGAISTWRARERVPYPECDEISLKERVSLDWLLTGEGEMYKSGSSASASLGADYVEVPRYRVHSSAGTGASNPDSEQLEPVAFRADWLSKRGIDSKQAFLLRNRGDSMEPDIKDEEWLLVDGADTLLIDGKVYIIRVDDDLFTKSLARRSDGWYAVSKNTAYQPFLLQENAKVIGRVRNSQKDW